MAQTEKENPLAKLRAVKINGKPMSWYAMANRLGVSPSCIRAWRAGMNQPSPENQAKIEALEKAIKA